jgi:predicted DNA-binding protein
MAPKSDSEKVSSSRSIGFRPGVEMRQWLEALSTETGLSITEILKHGVQAYRTEIEALARGRATGRRDETAQTLREYIEICRRAETHGIQPAKALSEAIQASHEREAWRQS